MGKIKLSFFSFVLLIISMPILFINCEGPSGPPGNSGPPGSVLTGIISGFVYLADPDTIYTDHSGVIIQIENTTFTTSTDSNGRWSIDELPTGTYNVLLSKNGFGYFKYTSVQFIGGGEYYIGTRYLASILELSIMIDTVFTHPFGVSISGERLNDVQGANSYYGKLFFSTNDSVSSTPNHYNYCYNLIFNYNSYTYSLSISKNKFYEAGFISGDTIFVSIYGTISWHHSIYGYLYGDYFRYIDPITGRYFYTHLGEKSNVLSFQLP